MTDKKVLLLCNGLSGSGKTTFIEKHIGKYDIYNLKSLTTRNMRDGEIWGDKYYFVDEDVFNIEPTATRLFVNEAFWTPDKPKWLYGVPEFEIMNHLGQHLAYDVIQPRYSRQLIDWFNAKGLNEYYDYKILWFLPPTNNMEIAAARATMPDDRGVRTTNTCDAIDFLRAGLQPDYILKSSAEETIIPDTLHKMIEIMKVTPGCSGTKFWPKKHPLEMVAQTAKLAHESGMHSADCRQLVRQYYLGR